MILERQIGQIAPLPASAVIAALQQWVGGGAAVDARLRHFET
jgi:hypothetical protein